MKVLLDSVDKVRRFAHIARSLDTGVYVQSGRFTVDGKSIMGLFSLDLLQALTVEFDDPKEEYEKAFWQLAVE